MGIFNWLFGKKKSTTYTGYTGYTGISKPSMTTEVGSNYDSCVSCGACSSVCPLKLDISGFIATYSDIKAGANNSLTNRHIDELLYHPGTPDSGRPSDCVGCGVCSGYCPVEVNIPAVLSDFTKELERILKKRESEGYDASAIIEELTAEYIKKYK